MTDTESLVAERAKTHGSFTKNASVSQSIKRLLRGQPGWESLNDAQREAIDMICCKLSRIMSGHGGFQDHWDDISGYANLASKDDSV